MVSCPMSDILPSLVIDILRIKKHILRLVSKFLQIRTILFLSSFRLSSLFGRPLVIVLPTFVYDVNV